MKKDFILQKKGLLSGVIFILFLCCMIQNINAIQQDPPYFEDTITLVHDSTMRVYADSSGTYYDIIGDSALAALIIASELGDFDVFIDDTWYESFDSLLVLKIGDKTNTGDDGWQFWNNYPFGDIPLVGADAYLLEDGDTLDWFFGEYGINPESSDMRISLHIEIVEDFNPPTLKKIIPTSGGIYLLGSKITTIPIPLAIVLGSVNLLAEYEDEYSMHRVSFYVDNELVQTVYTAPYTYNLKGLGTGSHRIKTIAYDSAQNTNTQEVEVLFVSN